MDSQVAAKAIIIHPDGERVLFLHKSGRDLWESPGGRLEAGELLKQGLAREIFEETGLRNVRIGDFTHADEWTPEINGKHQHIVAIFYRGDASETDVQLSGEHDDFAWLTLAEAEKINAATSSILAAKKIFSIR